MTNEDFIKQHIDEDVRRLALQKTPEGIDITWCLQQIEGYQLARKKLPGWTVQARKGGEEVEGGMIWFPPRLSMEQCSSELTAQYKRSVLERCLDGMGVKLDVSNFTDLTGGFGIDFSYMARGFKHATYVERMPHLCDIARHNFPLLGLEHANIVNGDAASVVDTSDSSGSSDSSDSGNSKGVIFLDPARRDDVGRKVFALEDCTPNLIELQDALLSHADLVMVKLSPMLDITQALRSVKCVSEVHVVSVQGECKEVLLVMKPNSSPESPSNSPDFSQEATCREHCTANGQQPVVYHCVNLGTDEDVLVCTEDEKNATPGLCKKVSVGNLLFEPNASILKAGVQDVLYDRYYMRKLHPISNLYIAPEVLIISKLTVEALLHPTKQVFPGRTFVIEEVGDFSKAGIKRVLGGLKQANITIRNFPGTVADLRKRFKLKEGGDVYIFVTTLADGSHAILRCSKAQS